MRLLMAAVIAVVPMAGSAQNDDACETMLGALIEASARLDQVAEAEAFHYEQMSELQERIGGAEGAALSVRANRHNTSVTARIDAARDAIIAATVDLSDFCSGE